MFGGRERDDLTVPAVVQVEIAGAVDEVEQAASGAVAEEILEVEEVAAGAVVDAANEVEEVAVGAVTDAANDVEKVAAGSVAEVVANGHIDVEEEEIDLNNISIHIEAQHTAKFDFMASVAEEDVAEPVIVSAQAVVADEAEEVVAVEEINPVHVPANVVAGEAEDLNSNRKSRYHFPSYLSLSLSLSYIKMFGGGERDNIAVPVVVQVEIVGAVDEAEQAVGSAIAEEIPEVEEVAAGAVVNAENEVDEVAAGAVADAANEVEEVTVGAVAEVVAKVISMLRKRRLI
ncbi:hypothetical protein TIFTF001_041837 [Ficus carica]|uniref:Uncharacterized protein n=1 Tax=Ficus carica TaxID=3494 RepID=A0AA87ZE70_FICCA|nr:hypothetical protein TIFTF001_041837 [Ficus carica]